MRVIQNLTYLFGVGFFLMGQLSIWYQPDKTVPSLLSSIILILTAIYLRDDNK